MNSSRLHLPEMSRRGGRGASESIQRREGEREKSMGRNKGEGEAVCSCSQSATPCQGENRGDWVSLNRARV